MNKGKLVAITAPSGAGKTTIARHLLHCFPQLAFSISATTRAIRKGETDGEDYFFISPKEFKERIERNEFVEWEEVYHGNFYGTLISEVEKLWEQGKIVLFDVDVQGAINLKKKFPFQTLTVFIKPPSAQILFERLHSRGTDPADKIEERISKAKHELELEEKFDHIIVNDNLRKALLESEEIVNQFISA